MILPLFFFICSHSSLSSPLTPTTKTHICPPQTCESAALLRFKQAFVINTYASSPPNNYHCGTSYPKTDSWKENNDCCIWEGVSCSSLTGHVIGLDLSCSQLYGKFPPNSSLFHLKHLKMLDLSGNDFMQSRISAEFGQFTNLTHLDLSCSGFSGQVPSEISHLSKLVSLHLSPSYHSLFSVDHSKLMLEGSTLKRLVQNFSEIRELMLFNVNMSLVDAGILTNLSTSLTYLDLSFCEIKGTIRDSLFCLPNLRMVAFYSKQNQLTVHLPKFNWTSGLEYLRLGGNVLSGQPPDSIGELKSLEHLSLIDCNLIGSIPTWIGNLSHIKFLGLFSNSLTGQIPSSFANLTRLVDLVLYDNLLNGTIPSWLFNLPSLSSIFLNDNKLQGQIPNSICELVSLTMLDLSSNNFSGIVELHKFSKLKSLRALDLSNNSLSLITDNIFNYTFPRLQFLALSSRNLSDFPTFLKESKDLVQLDLSKNRISGQIPKWMWDVGDILSTLILSYNFLTDPIQIPWQNIDTLDLRYNHFEVLLPVPPAGTSFFSISNNNLMGEVSSLFCILNFLEILDLSHNNLTGKIPRCLFNPSKSLLVLDLQSNNFDGIIPTTFKKECALTMLNLGGNQLQGSMPRSMANCRSLEVLDIGNNYINDTFPHWLDSLPDLQALVLRSNKFHGFVNNSKESARQPFPKLRVLDLSSNDFGGSLPIWYLENLKAMANVNQSKGVPRYMQVESYSILFGRSLYDYSVLLNIKGNSFEMEKVLTIFTSIDFCPITILKE